MKKLTNVSRLTYLTAALMAGVVLLASVSIADAKSRHHDNDAENNGMSSHFATNGQLAKEKKAWHEKKKKEKEKTVTRTKQCLYITSDGKRCGGTGSAKPPANGMAGNNSPPKTITVSNGVTTYTLPFDPKFSVEVVQPGSITVHSGDRTVTLPGGSITVHGQAVSNYAAERAGLQETINSRGDAVFAIKPQPQSQPPTQLVPVKDASSGGGIVDGVVDAGKAVGNGIVDAGKAIGNGIEDLGLGFINLGGPTPPPPKTSMTIQE